MDRDAIIQAIRELAPTLRERFGVASLGIFGSVARGDAGPDSDIDVLVGFDQGARITFFTLSDIRVAIEEVTGQGVDIVEDHEHLRPHFRRTVERDLVNVA